uniref:Uncharacterized protein n=1 Tax=Arundo donax TaxID=35708 RepID=A0A0A9HIY3_ARUDO
MSSCLICANDTMFHVIFVVCFSTWHSGGSIAC